METWYEMVGGKIKQSANFKKEPHWQLTDKEIVYGVDGQLYFKGEEPKESLEKTKEKALAIVKVLRKEKEYSGCTSQGILWDTDEKSERRLTSAVTVMKDAGLQAIPNFKPSDKVNVTLTLPMATQAGLDIMVHYGKCFDWEDAIIEQISKCTTNEEVKNIVNNL